MRVRWGEVLDARLDPLGATALGLGLRFALALALLLEEGLESVREQLVRAVTSAEIDIANPAPCRVEQKEAMDMPG
jgi:hypothetical protein